jgi:hypothetical protein
MTVVMAAIGSHGRMQANAALRRVRRSRTALPGRATEQHITAVCGWLDQTAKGLEVQASRLSWLHETGADARPAEALFRLMLDRFDALCRRADFLHARLYLDREGAPLDKVVGLQWARNAVRGVVPAQS